MVTNDEGVVHQFFLTNAWGEELHTYDNANTSSFNSEYRFNDDGVRSAASIERCARSAELDEETGLAYYGARYYDNQLSMWLSVDPLAMSGKNVSLTPYHFSSSNPVMRVDPDGMDDGWVEAQDGAIYWDDNATSQATAKEGETYFGENVLVGTHNRDENGNEEVNSAQFDLYLESDKTGPSATIKGNTVPSDPTKSGTLAEGLYSAKFSHRSKAKYKNELALRIYNMDGTDGLPTVNGNPSKANSDLLTGVLFHMGNNY